MGIFVFVGPAVLVAKAQGALLAAVTESAEDLVGKAQDRTPVDTGTLKASIHVAGIQGGGSSVTATVSTGGESSEYALYVHEGTYKMAGRPFLLNALLEEAPVYKEAMRRAVAGVF